MIKLILKLGLIPFVLGMFGLMTFYLNHLKAQGKMSLKVFEFYESLFLVSFLIFCLMFGIWTHNF